MEIIRNIIETTEIQVNKCVKEINNNVDTFKIINNLIIFDVKEKCNFSYKRDVCFNIANKITNTENITTLSTILNNKNVKLINFTKECGNTQKMNLICKANKEHTFLTEDGNIINLVGVICSNKKRKNNDLDYNKKYKENKEIENNVKKNNVPSEFGDKSINKQKINNEHKGTPKKGILKDVFKQNNNVEIIVLKEGTGNGAKKGDKINVKYIGRLENGKIFDKSMKECFSFTLGKGEVIKGWDVGLLGIKIGEKRKLIIEPVYGYGKKKIGKIPANSKLIFEVILEKI